MRELLGARKRPFVIPSAACPPVLTERLLKNQDERAVAAGASVTELGGVKESSPAKTEKTNVHTWTAPRKVGIPFSTIAMWQRCAVMPPESTAIATMTGGHHTAVWTGTERCVGWRWLYERMSTQTPGGIYNPQPQTWTDTSLPTRHSGRWVTQLLDWNER